VRIEIPTTFSRNAISAEAERTGALGIIANAFLFVPKQL